MTKKNILEIATQEFSRYGYDAVSMNNLASRLDVNKATIYYHFKDKRTLYHDVIQYILEDGRDEIENIVNTTGKPKEIFRKYIQVSIQRIKKRPHLVSLALREMANFSADVDTKIAPHINKEVEILKNILNKLDLKQKYKNIDFFTFHSLIYGTLHQYYAIQMSELELNNIKKFNQNSEEILDYISEFVTDILLDAICQDNK